MPSSAGDQVLPTARDLVELHLKARGGRTALARLGAVIREGTIEAHCSDGLRVGSYRTAIRYPDTGFIEIRAGSLQVLEGITPLGAFVADPDERVFRPAEPGRQAELRSTAREANRELLYLDSSLMTVASVDDTEWRLEQAEPLPEGSSYRFSKQSRLLLGKRIGSRSRVYWSWRSVQGILFPFETSDHYAGELRFRVNLDSIVLAQDLSCAWCADLVEKLARSET